MVKQLTETLKNLHVPMKTENQKTISRFTRLMQTINKLEERMDSFRNEMSLFTRISSIINSPIVSNKPEPKQIIEEIGTQDSVYISDDEEKEKTGELSGVYGEYAKKLVMGEKLASFIEIYAKMKEKKKEHVEFFALKIKEIMKEMSVFQELDNPRLLYLLRKIQKLKSNLIRMLPEHK